MSSRSVPASLALVFLLGATLPALGAPAPAMSRSIAFHYTPTSRAQIAVWIEKPDGTFLKTVRLTQAVAVRGIGNRPGATQMNSGFRWPYGRREGVLPIWAHRRAAAAGADQFKRVIFQDRTFEGWASRSSADSTTESYFCLSFDSSTTRRDALDATTCASAFSSDKGRFLNQTDVAKPYIEPAQVDGAAIMRALGLDSLYPPRRDVSPCQETGVTPCYDHPDVALYADHVRQVMPDIDAVTMATPPGGMEQSVLFTAPDDWPDGDYVAFIEVSKEGDYNATFNDQTFPTPTEPSAEWDSWAITFGYPYRGQPSVVYSVPFTLGQQGVFNTVEPVGYGSVDGISDDGAVLNPMDAKITEDVPGSGADRLMLVSPHNYRFQISLNDAEACREILPPAAPTGMSSQPVSDEKHSHQWGVLTFIAPASFKPLDHYEVRYSTRAIVAGNDGSFTQALPAVGASLETEALMVPVTAQAGETVRVEFGGMDALTHYWIGVRAVDSCNNAGPFTVSELTTSRVNFTQLSGCFVATAAYGSAMEPQVGALRVARDALRARSGLFSAATDLYYQAGPAAAAVLSRSDLSRAVVRTLLAPVADLASAATGPATRALR